MGRPKVPIVSRELVIERALGIIDNEGMAALSLRHLAETVGVNIGSLYHHYRYKDDILRDVVLHVLEPLNQAPAPVLDWKDYFLQRSRTYIRVLTAHPNIARLTFDLLPHNYLLPVEEQAVEVLCDAGVPVRYAVLVREQVDSIVRGVMHFTFETPLYGAIRPDFPFLQAATRAAAEASAEERLEFAIRCLLDGVELRIPQWQRAAESIPSADRT